MSQPPPARIDIDRIRNQALSCTRCRLAESRTQVVWAAGNLDANLMFIGEGPGFHEDQQGVPFVGAAGQLLDRLLAEIELDRSQIAIVNVVKCRPPGNRDPLPDEIEACRPYLEAQMEYMRPDVIVTLGNFATRFVIQQPLGITKARGQLFRYRGAVVIPTFHPAAALRGGRFGGVSPIDAIREDLQVVRARLTEARERRMTVASAPGVTAPGVTAPSAEDPSEQLGLF